MSLPETVSSLLSDRSVVTFPVILAVGFVSTLQNPCAIPLYPAAAAACLVRGSTDEDFRPSARPHTSLINAVAFVTGMALSIAILGLAAAAAGRVVGVGRWGRYLIALIPVLMGLQRLGWIRLPVREFKLSTRFRPGLGGAFATGLLLSLVIGTCGSAVLASVLAFAAYRQAFAYGGLLLFAYGIGAGIPFVTFGAIVGKLTQWIARKGYQKWTEFALGGMMLCLGFYLFWLA
jgi:cytochrome c biogenesis protein CcdA